MAYKGMDDAQLEASANQLSTMARSLDALVFRKSLLGHLLEVLVQVRPVGEPLARRLPFVSRSGNMNVLELVLGVHVDAGEARSAFARREGRLHDARVNSKAVDSCETCAVRENRANKMMMITFVKPEANGIRVDRLRSTARSGRLAAKSAEPTTYLANFRILPVQIGLLWSK